MVAEGTGGQTAMVFSVTLSVPSQVPVQVDYATEDVTAGALQPFLDYVPAAGTLVFGPKSIKATLTVLVNADTHDEPDETLIMRLSQPLHGTIRDQEGIGTILDDDPPPPDVALISPNGGEFYVPRPDREGRLDRDQRRRDHGHRPLHFVRCRELVPFDRDGRGQRRHLRLDGGRPGGRPADAGLTPMVRVVAHATEGDDAQDQSEHVFTIVDPRLLGADPTAVTEFALAPVMPNPGRGPFTVTYALPRSAPVRVSVIDVQGREIAVLADGELPAGRHRATWEGAAKAPPPVCTSCTTSPRSGASCGGWRSPVEPKPAIRKHRPRMSLFRRPAPGKISA